MNKNTYQRRFYRDWVSAKDLYNNRLVCQETDLQILTDKPVDQEWISAKVVWYRRQIEGYIWRDKRFLTALKPIAIEVNAPVVVKEMVSAARKANVGPMAAVAGAIAEAVARLLLKQGYRDVIIENGGDIFLATTKIRTVSIYAGKSSLWKGLSLKILAQQSPLGICTSSGTIGHSLSFGCADSVTILARHAALADAVATATGNRVHSQSDLPKALDFARSIKGVLGAVIIIGRHLASFGAVEFVS